MNLAILAILLAPLTLGPHPAGFSEWREDGLAVSVWYPARGVERPMTFGDYVRDRAGLEKFMSGAGVGAETIRAYLAAPMSAGRDARRLPGRFPLVLVAQGNGQEAADQAVLCEYLASHGFIVATTPSPMLETPMTSEAEVGKFAELQASQLGRAIAIVARRFRVDERAIGIVGHSFGARAALLLAMNDRRIGALVSLDGGIGTAVGLNEMRNAPSFKRGTAPPVLHLYASEPDLTLLREASPQSLHTERIGALRHIHFTTLGFAAAALPELRQLTRGGEEMADSLRHVAERTARFLRMHRKTPRPSNPATPPSATRP